MQPTIRPAVPSDIALILQLIRELADYERLLDSVVATENLLREALFGEQPKAEVLIAEVAHQPAGFALFFGTFSTFLGRPGLYLEDLFVKPQFRGHGIGKALLAQLAQIALNRNCGRLEWAVLDWNHPAIGFYKSLGAIPQDEWTVFRVTGNALIKLAALTPVLLP